MRIVKRESLMDISDYKEMFEKESHHNHEIIMDNYGAIRWKEDKQVSARVEVLGLNEIIMEFHEKGINKNSEEYRELYRNMGYSLSGYYDVFYWEVNNPIAEEYRK
jgi:hypothetical protein